MDTLLGQHGLVLVRQFAQFLVARPHGHTPLGGMAVQQLLTNLQDVACLLGLYCIAMCANQYNKKLLFFLGGGVGGGGGTVARGGHSPLTTHIHTSSIMVSLVRVSWWSKMSDSLRGRQPLKFSSPRMYVVEVSTIGPWNSAEREREGEGGSE